MAQESANEESKSSAGDKYETGRAMAHLDIENSSSQLAEANKLRKLLKDINPEMISPTVQLGSLVYTNQLNYFMAIPMGKTEVDGAIWYVVSQASPVGKLLSGKASKDEVVLNGKSFSIMRIE